MIKLFSKVAALALVGMLALPLVGEAKMVLKAGHGLTEASGLHAGFAKFKEELEKLSKGEMIVEIYPNQQLGGDRELIEGVQLGNVTLTAPSSPPLAAFSKDFFILDAPFLFADRPEAFAAFDGEMGDYLNKQLEKINIVGLGYWENGFRNLTNSRNEVKTPADVKGLKLRTMENAIHLELWKALGANPTPMAFGELFTAMQQKTVDGQENPFGQIFDNKFYEVQPYITKTRHLYISYPFIINKEFYDDLSDEERGWVDTAARTATVYQRKAAEALDDEKAESVLKAGRKIVDLTPEQINAFREGTKSVASVIKERVTPEAFKLYQDYVNKAK